MGRPRVLGLVLLLGLAGCSTTYKPPKTKKPSKVSKGEFPHELLDEVLKAHCKDGFVDYAALGRDREKLDRFLEAVSKFSPVSRRDLFPDKDHALAYWINAYNALVLQSVLGRYPEIEEVDTGDAFTVGRRVLDLKTLEDDYIRARCKEPRIHFALNRAALGGPRLPDEAFTPEEVEEQLDRETKKFVAEERNVRIDEGAGTLYISRVFHPDWYQRDFIEQSFVPGVKAGKTPEEKVIGYINHYRAGDKKIPEREKGWAIVYNAYDRTLNDRKASR